ncbi:hypothetical protein EVAR_102248_1 [Eumeta japonica]|uniref:Uncharacterized protein n=1 Tax=Eumeta variegata TaxID=151549 RepID=A0A4C1WGQ1_EUMVA|nr:hypothetical protein EVAR_102248_1 [Eumeta japonica]
MKSFISPEVALRDPKKGNTLRSFVQQVDKSGGSNQPGNRANSRIPTSAALDLHQVGVRSANPNSAMHAQHPEPGQVFQTVLSVTGMGALGSGVTAHTSRARVATSPGESRLTLGKFALHYNSVVVAFASRRF